MHDTPPMVTGAGDNRLPALAQAIRAAHTDVQDAVRTAAERALDAGHALLEAKELIPHGRWLPWLREHCALPERTAQLYMRIAASGLKSATVADLGLAAAAKALVIHLPDPFADSPEPELNEWRLYVLFGMQGGYRCEVVTHYCEWLKRTGWDSPSEWVSAGGDRYRQRMGMRPLPPENKRAWYAFLAERCDWPTADINAAIERLLAAEPPEAPKPQRRRARGRPRS